MHVYVHFEHALSGIVQRSSDVSAYMLHELNLL